MKKDGHFQVPIKKTDPVVYQVQKCRCKTGFLGEFRAAKGLKARVAVASEIVRNAHDLLDLAAVANEVTAALNTEIASYLRTQPAVALEGLFARDDLRAMAGLAPGEGETTAAQIWSQDVKFGALMEALPAAKHRRALDSFKAVNPERWHESVRGAMNTVSARLCREFANLLIQEGKFNEVKETIARLISQHTASSELLHWVAKDRNDAFADILGPEVSARCSPPWSATSSTSGAPTRLREFILDDPELLADLTAAADLEVVKDLTRALRLTSVFDDMDKRSLLARLVKSHPAVQSFVTGEQTRQEVRTHRLVGEPATPER